MAPVYKLKSYDFVGLAEPIRYMLAYAGIPYENIIIKKDVAWSDIQKTVPFGKLPVMEVDDKILLNSIPMCWYLANSFGLSSSDTLEEAELGSFCHNLQEFGQKFFDWYLEEDKYIKEKWETELEQYMIPKYLADFEEIVQNKGGYFGGKKISWADIYFAAVMVTVQDVWKNDFFMQKQYPLLFQLYKDVHNIPAIKAYVTKFVPNYKY